MEKHPGTGKKPPAKAKPKSRGTAKRVFFGFFVILLVMLTGINTMWYVQFQRVCAILLLSTWDTSYASDMACETNIILA